MLGRCLGIIYLSLREMGLVRSKRAFSRTYLSRGWSYMRDLEHRGRQDAKVPAATIRALRGRLKAVARLLPPSLKVEVERVIAVIDRDAEIADLLDYGRGRR